MKIARRPRKSRPESIVPMINVVFLLLIFFLMTAQIAPPEPFDVALPAAETDAPSDGATVLYLSATGDLAYRDHIGPEAVARVANDAEDTPVELRADASVEGTAVARLLRDLAQAGVREVTLVTAAP